MQLTRRALALLLAGALPLAAGAIWTPALFLAPAYLALVLGLLFADIAISPQRRHFDLIRHCDSKLSLAADNLIRLRLRNYSHNTVAIAVRDELPTGFHTDRWQVAGVVAPKSELVLTYHVKPFRVEATTASAISISATVAGLASSYDRNATRPPRR